MTDCRFVSGRRPATRRPEVVAQLDPTPRDRRSAAKAQRHRCVRLRGLIRCPAQFAPS